MMGILSKLQREEADESKRLRVSEEGSVWPAELGGTLDISRHKTYVAVVCNNNTNSYG